MRQLNFLLRVLLPVLIWSGSLQYLAQSERVESLEVVDAQPSPAGRLALDDAITFTFNRRVNCAEAEAALNWQPAIRRTPELRRIRSHLRANRAIPARY